MTPTELLSKTYNYIQQEQNGFNMLCWNSAIRRAPPSDPHTKKYCTSVRCIGGTMEHLYRASSAHNDRQWTAYRRDFGGSRHTTQDMQIPYTELPEYSGMYKAKTILWHCNAKMFVLAKILDCNVHAIKNLCYPPSVSDMLWNHVDELNDQTTEDDDIVTTTWDNITREEALIAIVKFAAYLKVTLDI